MKPKRAPMKLLVLNRPPAKGRHGWSDGGANRRPFPPQRTYKSGTVL